MGMINLHYSTCMKSFTRKIVKKLFFFQKKTVIWNKQFFSEKKFLFGKNTYFLKKKVFGEKKFEGKKL